MWLGPFYFCRAWGLRAPHPPVSIRRRRGHGIVLLQITKRTVQPGTIVLEITRSLPCPPHCTNPAQEGDKPIESKEIRVIFDMSGVTDADSAAIGTIVKCFTKLKSA